MNTRIKEIRENAGLTQEEFGKKIGSARNTIANYETGNRKPSNSVIVSICREFNVNEEWLRTGNGDMFIFPEDKLSKHLAQIAKGNDDFIKDIIEVYMELDDTSRSALKKLTYKMIEKQNEKYSNANEKSSNPTSVEFAEEEYIKKISDFAHHKNSTALSSTEENTENQANKKKTGNE